MTTNTDKKINTDKENDSDPFFKWKWIMDYCKKNGTSPAISFNWKNAEKEFNKKLKEFKLK